ncbi:glyoxylase-like metal-dependent hydrolase (beta-lactamase superfamily II) [Nonomuraea thailandensis]|uniref:Glyoxylase-like metal-dependent hydrolase (Beta-lactamase superfamily II) n=1 Tax=Nonomuraea thailandensis TaxID=1188745 RepID=A0A9X2GIU9_9ACTN|nr:MBL fold metallo-hydrolase [Nonomuraea thailandensis]MCP2358520.1 glyoxylase-like metal-dependent hydrolase (beta-lactamase superfamily II) [Nonomuraea thailandensis]
MIGHTVTSGTFSLGGQTFDVDNNVWVLGNDSECVIFDAPHDVEAIIDLVAGRNVLAVLATHAHDDHIGHAPQLAERTGAPILLHAADLPLWRLTHPDREPDGMLVADEIVKVAGTSLQVLHTPGHTPGACSFYAPDRRRRLHGRHSLPGRAWCDRPLVLRLRPDHRLHPPSAAHPPTGDGRAHRARHRHDDRR